MHSDVSMWKFLRWLFSEGPNPHSPHVATYVPLFREVSPDGQVEVVLTREPYFGQNQQPLHSHTTYLFLLTSGQDPGTRYEAKFTRWEDTTAIKVLWRSNSEFEVHGEFDECLLSGTRLQLLGNENYSTLFRII